MASSFRKSSGEPLIFARDADNAWWRCRMLNIVRTSITSSPPSASGRPMDRSTRMRAYVAKPIPTGTAPVPCGNDTGCVFTKYNGSKSLTKPDDAIEDANTPPPLMTPSAEPRAVCCTASMSRPMTAPVTAISISSMPAIIPSASSAYPAAARSPLSGTYPARGSSKSCATDRLSKVGRVRHRQHSKSTNEPKTIAYPL